MAFEKITEQDRVNKGNVGLPDTPEFTTTEMQERMDSLANLAIDKFNELIDALNANKAATNLGATVPEGLQAQANVQSILNAMVLNLTLNTQNRHSHSNKAVLDVLTSDMFTAYNALVTLLAGITNVSLFIDNTDTAIPTCKAVKTYADNLNINQKVLTFAFPIGCVFSTKGSNPASVLGGTWSLIDEDASGVKRYERTA